ncbi:MAG: toxin [Rhizobiaceae bacterium]|nr:toxin [Rhizobiaceae bacterium]
MKTINWNLLKNDWLKQHRGYQFEEVLEAIDNGLLLADLPNPSENFPEQRIFVVEIRAYAIVVPYVEDKDSFFLKTMYADRRATRKYLRGLKK